MTYIRNKVGRPEPKWVEKLKKYHGKELSFKELIEILGVKKSTIRAYVEYHNFPMRKEIRNGYGVNVYKIKWGVEY